MGMQHCRITMKELIAIVY